MGYAGRPGLFPVRPRRQALPQDGCRGSRTALPFRRAAGPRHLLPAGIAPLLDVLAPDHDGHRARRGRNPLQQALLRLPLPRRHGRRPADPAAQGPEGQDAESRWRPGQSPPLRKVRPAFLDCLHDRHFQRIVLQEPGSLLRRRDRLQGRDHPLDVARHRGYRHPAGPFHRPFLVQVCLPAGRHLQYLQILGLAGRPGPALVGPEPAGRPFQLGLAAGHFLPGRLSPGDPQRETQAPGPAHHQG